MLQSTSKNLESALSGVLALNKADKFVTYPYQGPVNQQKPNMHVLQM